MTQERIDQSQAKERPSMSTATKLITAAVLAATLFVMPNKANAGLKEAQARQAQENEKVQAELKRSEANLQRSEANLQRSETESKLVHECGAVQRRVEEIYTALKSMDPKSNEARKLLDELVELKAKLIANGEARAQINPKFCEAEDYKTYTNIPNGIDKVLALLHYEPKGPIVLSENTVNGKGK